MINIEVIQEKRSFANAWAEAVKRIMNNKHSITFGGKLKEKNQYEVKVAYDSKTIIELKGNALKEAIEGKLHPKFPTKENHLREYLKEWERDFDWKKQGFTYCYEARIEKYGDIEIDQWELAREDLKNQIRTALPSNRNAIVIGIPLIDRYVIPDSPPCLREIAIRYEGNGICSVDSVWRSRDCFGALQSNIAGLLTAVIREVMLPTNCRIGTYTDYSRSLHIYKGDWEEAEKVKPVLVNPQITF